MKAKITGIAHYVPGRVVNNVELSERYSTITSERILAKTGIKERRYSDDLTSADMATKSIEKLLEKTGTRADEIDCIIVGTLTPDYFFPSTAVVVIKNVKAVNAFGFDTVAACPSFLYGLEQAQMMIQVGKAKKIIVCGTDRMSKTINAFEHKTGVLFGDAAASVLVEVCTDTEKGINTCLSKVVADDLDDLYFRTPFNSEDYSTEKFNLAGRQVYKNGVGLTAQTINDFLKKNGLTVSDFKYIIPHQANINMLRDIAEQINAPFEMFLTNIEFNGNTAGASVPLCFSQNVDLEIIQKGDRLLLVSFGAGYTLSIADLYF
jgi:3-oxoacyl-[acyl-carrier-protein] synthase-3